MDPGTLVINIFVASLVMAGLELPLIGIYYSLWFLTGGEKRYKRAIRISVVATFWFLILAMASLALLTFGQLPESAPSVLFVAVLGGAILVALTVLVAAALKVVDQFPSPKAVEPMERKPPTPPP
jgi:hypothetical protein